MKCILRNQLFQRCALSHPDVICAGFKNNSNASRILPMQQSQLLIQARPQSVSYKVMKGSSVEPPLVLAHGVCGNKHNFNTVGKKLSAVLDRTVVTFDARNHGNSFHSDAMDLTDLTSDIVSLLDILGIDKCVLVGHSMGGRTSMVTALLHPERISQLVVVDASPNKTASRSSVQSHIEAMQTCDFSTATTLTEARKVADQQLEAAGTPPTIRAFLLQNIVSRHGFQWRVNLDAIISHLRNNNTILDHPPEHLRYDGNTLFLCGSKSNYVKSDDFPTIRKLFPNVVITHIPDAGHWVHADKPNEFIKNIKDFVEPTQTKSLF